MSAHIVSDETISGMFQPTDTERGATYYYRGSRRLTRVESGQVLVDQNYRSVNSRYGTSDKPHKYSNPPVRRLKPVEILKLCSCYDYQACETTDYEASEAFRIVSALRTRAIQMLDGYEEAEWGL